jgi:hypothetical protein
MDDSKIYQRIGKFVVCFQFIESQIRQIGWILVDPGRKIWPPEAFRKEKAEVLADKVSAIYVERLHLCRLPDEAERIEEFKRLILEFHELRRFRNRVLHSALFEIKGGGEVLGLMRSNPRFIIDPETGDKSIDNESLSEESFAEEMGRMGQLAFDLGQHYLPLIARMPTQ